jgi:hypothetical protein
VAKTCAIVVLTPAEAFRLKPEATVGPKADDLEFPIAMVAGARNRLNVDFS